MRLEHRPLFPDGYRPGIAIVGCGGVVRGGHLPAYEKYGCHVVGVHDESEELATSVGLPVFRTVDELLAHPEVQIVDVATPRESRLFIVRRALAAGKHVLAQKPLATDLEEARALVDEADLLSVRLAVNQNARWAPSWRVATLLIQQGAAGDAFSVTHLLEKRFDFVLDSPRLDAMPHFLLFDYCIHWIDISRCWLERDRPVEVRASDHRTPDQPPEARNGWGASVEIRYASGANVMIRTVGDVRTARPAAPFWIHGTDGTIRGSVLLGSEFLELDRDGETTRYELQGAWFPDGFAGTLAELLTAVAEDREPYNSARHNLLSLELTLAACRSAEQDGRPVSVGATGTSSARS
jgi:predicted dehydrogenase